MLFSENTKVTMGIVLVFIPGVFWLTTIFAQGVHNSKEIEEIKGNVEKRLDKIDSKLEALDLKIDRKFERVEERIKGSR
jgi:hypothetical protein